MTPRHRDNPCGGCSRAETSPGGPDLWMLIAAGVMLIGVAAGVVLVMGWSAWSFMAPISQAPVARATK